MLTVTSDHAFLNRRDEEKIYPVVVEAVGMCEIAAAISKDGGKRGKRFHRFPMLSSDRHFHGPIGILPIPRWQYT